MSDNPGIGFDATSLVKEQKFYFTPDSIQPKPEPVLHPIPR